MADMKYVLVSGGVISGIGKGLIASSTGLLLKTKGLTVAMIKIDPYLNIDAGTLSPFEHGEVYVLDDGGETDLDLGNYERYVNITLTSKHNITTGKIYRQVIQGERDGEYLGKTVQVIPHVTDAIQNWIEETAKIPVDETKQRPDICVIELGGTIGDIENAPFIEAFRQFRSRVGKDNFLQVHVSMIPVINDEQKTKPTQQSIRDVRSAGLHPDLIACRCTEPLDKATLEKVAMYCQVEPDQVIGVKDVKSTYLVPEVLRDQNYVTALSKVLSLDKIDIPPNLKLAGNITWDKWRSSTMIKHDVPIVKIAVVGKYTTFPDSYLSLSKALEHAAMACDRRLELVFVDSSDLYEGMQRDILRRYQKAWKHVHTADGIIVPGGFGKRGTVGMLAAIKLAREKKRPFLGICFGMQMAVVEFARNVCGFDHANSAELDQDATDKVVIRMSELNPKKMGGTMRLGSRPTTFQKGAEKSKVLVMYQSKVYYDSPFKRSERRISLDQIPASDFVVDERHRHRYEVNPRYVERFESKGLKFVGRGDEGNRMEILELDNHPWFVGTQYHPEYKSRVLEPSRPFLGFVATAAGCLDRFVL